VLLDLDLEEFLDEFKGGPVQRGDRRLLAVAVFIDLTPR
jgi:hypothetical protein